MFVYRIRNIINYCSYIGLTKKPIKKRFERHINEAENGSKVYLKRAIRKYGKKNFKISLLAKIEQSGNFQEDIEALKNAEIAFIKRYKTYCGDGFGGYNMTRGGDGVSGWIPDKQTRKLWHKQRKDNKNWIKKGRTEKQEKKARRKRMIKLRRGKKPWNYGLDKTDKRVAKYSNSTNKERINRIIKFNSRAIIGINIKTKKKIEFKRIHDACKFFNCSRKAINRRIKYKGEKDVSAYFMKDKHQFDKLNQYYLQFKSTKYIPKGLK